jgi:hypothetical protein
MITLIGLSLAFSIGLAVHVVRTGREMYWLWIILAFQPLGGVVYFLTNVLPDLVGGSRSRQLQAAARAALDPTREYREAKAVCEDTPTVRNQSRLAAAAAGLGKFDEAEALYREAAQGIHAEDPALLLGRANALLELNRPREALEVLEVLGRDEANGRTPTAALALGRAYEGVGSIGQADTAYQWAAQRLPGFEGLARYAAFMARHGRREEAAEAVAEMDKRLAKQRGHFKKEARTWRDHAAQALAEG